MMPRTTSACAENTEAKVEEMQRERNYLRVRGEYILGESHKNSFLELPPRARRILDAAYRAGLLSGTTSACAENTHRVHTTIVKPRNYLRVRGEYSLNS